MKEIEIYKKALKLACRNIAEIMDIKPIPFVKPDMKKIRQYGKKYESYFIDQAEKEK